MRRSWSCENQGKEGGAAGAAGAKALPLEELGRPLEVMGSWCNEESGRRSGGRGQPRPSHLEATLK